MSHERYLIVLWQVTAVMCGKTGCICLVPTVEQVEQRWKDCAAVLLGSLDAPNERRKQNPIIASFPMVNTLLSNTETSLRPKSGHNIRGPVCRL